MRFCVVLLGFVSITSLSVLDACGGSDTPPIAEMQAPSVYTQSSKYESNPQARRGTKVWGVGASGYSGGPAGGTFLFAYCDTTIYTQQPSSGCYGAVPYHYGKRSLSVAYNATDPCYQGSPGYGTCSGALGTIVSLGKLGIDALVSASGSPSDHTYVSEGSVQVSAFTDEATVTSGSLPNGTTVTLKETIQLSGTFTFDCANIGLLAALYSMSSMGYVTGDCENGTFVQTTSNGPGTKESTKFQETVGKTFTINPTLATELNVWDCSSGNSGNCYAWGTPYSASMNIPTVSYHLAPVTKNVTLVWSDPRRG